MSGLSKRKNKDAMTRVNLKKNILFPSTLLLFASIFLSIQFAWNLEENHIEAVATQHKSGILNSFQAKLNDDVDLMRASMSFLLQDSFLINALKNEDQNALLNSSLATFERLKNQHNITHLYFHNISRVNILRTHKPDRFGDVINRFTATSAEKTGKEYSGLELGPLGTFTLRLVTPVYEKGQLIGYIEIGKEIDNILQNIHKQMDVELLVFINKDLVDVEVWREGNEMLGRSAEWELLPNLILMSQTLPELPVNLLNMFHEQMASNDNWNEIITFNDSEFRTSVIPLSDASNMQVGFMVTMRDITGLLVSAEKDLFDTIILVAVLGMIVFLFIYAVLGKAEKNLDSTSAKLEKSLDGTVTTIGKISELKDPYTAGHQSHVARIAVAIAQEMRLSEDCIRGINMGAMIHDVGKIQIPSDILNKPGRLDEIETALIKRHSEAGYGILKNIDFSHPVALIAYQHHERMDGSGYPQGLMGDDIIMEARIIAVADVIEAMTSHRPYRAGLGIEKAFEEIRKNQNILYDKHVVDASLQILTESIVKG